MGTKNIKCRATLIKATPLDVFNNDGSLKENKILFCRHTKTKDFYGTYRIPSSDDYYIEEMNFLLQLDFLYVLTPEHNENDFCFYLFLRPGNSFDFFYSPKWVKPNVIYYVKTDDYEVTGPHIMLEDTDIELLNKAVKEGRLYVPEKQKFEPYKIQKSA